jgi:hypothetical protein
MRKIKVFTLLLLGTLAMTSCFDNTGLQSTPQMQFGNLYVNPRFVGDTLVGAKDTLYDHFNAELGLLYVDTLQLGDTLMFPSLFTSYTNNLVNITTSYDTVNVNLWFDIDMQDPDKKKALAAGSDPQKGMLFFNPMYNQAVFNIYIVPQKAGSYPLKFSVTSDSEFASNSHVFTLPVK